MAAFSEWQAITVAFGPGRKLARTRQATGPRRRWRLAGWTWSTSNGRDATMPPCSASAVISCAGSIPVDLSPPIPSILTSSGEA